MPIISAHFRIEVVCEDTEGVCRDSLATKEILATPPKIAPAGDQGSQQTPDDRSSMVPVKAIG
jgi:hypothetical protein